MFYLRLRYYFVLGIDVWLGGGLVIGGFGFVEFVSGWWGGFGF